jgi:hypothetical protein
MDMGVDMDMAIFFCFGLFRMVLWCFSFIQTSKLSVSILKRNNQNKRLVSDSNETSIGSSF